MAAGSYELGRILGNIRDEELYLESEYETFTDYVTEELALTRATAYFGKSDPPAALRS